MASARTIKRNVCFVTGTRADFGLMRSTLLAIQSHPALRLQLIVTGMHLDRSRGQSIRAIRKDGWKIDHVVPWPISRSQTSTAVSTGRALANLADAFGELKSEIVLVVGDRVEAFAAASAAHISGRIVAHVHGGDRALGLVDDSLRHAISKLAHVHFPATSQSAGRLRNLGEDSWRIHTVGSPGLDDLSEARSWKAINERFPALRLRQFALVVLHPSTVESGAERLVAEMLLAAVQRDGAEQAVIVYPNNDPGADGIMACWAQAARRGNANWHFCRDLPRPLYLGLLRDAAMLVGNSSSGIIEAASFGTPVIDVGSRQNGRERGNNVRNVAASPAALQRTIREIWNNGKPRRFGNENPYGSGNTGSSIAACLARLDVPRHVRKLIAY
jgi:UDP-N-acetylglucosamine 2-epimerase (non-hydrolysing)/GDP/UDP-N,N'-diacetylbacillosamine 2-epimerase (hydrolysing)